MRDLWSEAVASAFSRPGRAALTAIGTILGLATLVATVGLSRTAGFQIVDRFDSLAATEVDVSPASAGVSADGAAVSDAAAIPWDSEQRLHRLNGVQSAGTLSAVAMPAGTSLEVRSVPVVDPQAPVPLPPQLVAASPGLFGAVRAHLSAGRVFDQGHNERADAVAVVGANAAKRLGVDDVALQPHLWINDRLFAVVGVIDSLQREKGLLEAVVIPDGTARAYFGLAAPQRVVVDTKLGAARLIASQAPVALSPNAPERVTAAPGWEPTDVRRGVQDDVSGLLVLLGGIALLVGVIGIANVTLVSVLERVGEIGLRRALGASRTHIAAQFVTESGVIGLLAGVIGSSLGVVAVVAVSAARDWTPVLDAWLPFAAVGLGAVAGLLAGLYPAWRASRLEPVEALRTGM